MTWLIVALLALGAAVFTIWILRAPRSGWEAIACALVLGIAGYAFQGRPDLPSAPGSAQAGNRIDGETVVAARMALSTSSIPTRNRWVILSDALARRGRFGDAVETLRVATDDNPRDWESWLAMGNALVAHAEGVPTEAALTAYRRSIALAPALPGPRFFYGTALVQSGDATGGRAQLQAALDTAPDDASYRPFVAMTLARLDAAMEKAPGADDDDVRADAADSAAEQSR